MLAELRDAHDRLLAGIQDLEDAAGAEAPDSSLLAAIRWRLSQASGRRRRLVDEASAEVLRRKPGAAPEIERLRENSAEMLFASSRHVGGWPIERIRREWQGYRAASAEMRRAMRARIEMEKAILYPLLA
jgi:hypothetical protein